jgi:hypothetical protein
MSDVKAVSMVVLLENFFTTIFETRGWFPHCFRNVIAFPFDVVLMSSASFSMIEDSLDFPSFFIIINVWWWSKEVGPVSLGFRIWHKECSMEHISLIG